MPGATKGPNDMPHTAILRPPQAAKYLGLSESTLAKRRLRGDPPIFLKITSRAVGYLVDDLDTYLAVCRRRSTSESGLGE